MRKNNHKPLFPYAWSVCLAVAICVCLGATLAGESGSVIWSTDFEQGNGMDVRRSEAGQILFSAEPDPGDGSYLWFYLKIINDYSDPLEFVLENAAGAHQTGKRWAYTRPFFSTNGKDWTRARSSVYRKPSGLSELFSDPVYRFIAPFAADTIYLAYFRPYTLTDLRLFTEEISTDSAVSTFSLGHSEDKREIPGLCIGCTADIEKPDIIWIVCREHPGETPASFVCEGLIRSLLQDSTGRKLLEKYTFKIVPILNVDGVTEGHYYHNSNGINLARDWAEFKSEEVRSLKSCIEQDLTESTIALMINLHSSNDPGRGHFFLEMPSRSLTPKGAVLQQNLFQAAKGKHPQIQGKRPVKLLDLPGITGNALYRRHGIYCWYVESNYSLGADGSDVTVNSLRQTGKALVDILAEVLIPE